MALAATEVAPASRPAPYKYPPYIPAEIEGVPDDCYVVRVRNDALIRARTKDIREVYLREGTKIAYRVTKRLRECASDVLSILEYKMASHPFGITLSYAEMVRQLAGRYCEKFVMIACKLLTLCGLVEPPRQVSGHNRSLTWRLPPRQALIAALVKAHQGEGGAETKRADDRSEPPQPSKYSGTAQPLNSFATDDTTCSETAQDMPSHKDVQASAPPHDEPPPPAHDQIAPAWDADAIQRLIDQLCPLERALRPHEPKIIAAQARLIFERTTQVPAEEAYRRVSWTIKYMMQEQPFYKERHAVVPFCVGKHYEEMYREMTAHHWTPPDEAQRDRQAAQYESLMQGARRARVARLARQHDLDLNALSDEQWDALSLALEQAQHAEWQRQLADPAFASSDEPYLRLFAEFGCVPRAANNEPAPAACADTTQSHAETIFSYLCEAPPPKDGEQRPGMDVADADLLVRRLLREKPGHQIGYRTSDYGGVVLAIQYYSRPDERYNEWLDIYQPEEWPGVWGARARESHRRFEEQYQARRTAARIGAVRQQT